MQDILIRNTSSAADTVALMYVSFYIAGRKELAEQGNILIKEQRLNTGDIAYLVSDYDTNNIGWKEAAEGLAKMIEEQRSKRT